MNALRDFLLGLVAVVVAPVVILIVVITDLGHYVIHGEDSPR